MRTTKIGLTEEEMKHGHNGGCGAPIHVIGTNAGTLPCGSLLTMFGETKPYYCGLCARHANATIKDDGR